MKGLQAPERGRPARIPMRAGRPALRPGHRLPYANVGGVPGSGDGELGGAGGGAIGSSAGTPGRGGASSGRGGGDGCPGGWAGGGTSAPPGRGLFGAVSR